MKAKVFIFLALLVSSRVGAQGYDVDNHVPPSTSQSKYTPVRALDYPCLLVVNYVLPDSLPIVQMTTHGNQYWPVLYNLTAINDTTFCIEIRLPYEFPTRLPKYPKFRPPQGCFTLYVAYETETDTAEYHVTFVRNSLELSIETVKSTKFVELQRLHSISDDLVLLSFPDYERARVARKEMSGLAKAVQLKPGFYLGIPFRVEKGRDKMNEIPQGVVLALKLPNDPKERGRAEEKLKAYNAVGGFLNSPDQPSRRHGLLLPRL